jgi:hypothetical protein
LPAPIPIPEYPKVVENDQILPETSTPVVIRPDAMVSIAEQLEKNVVKHDELVHGIYINVRTTMQ